MAQEQTRRPRTGGECFAAYLDEIAVVMGHASRVASAQAYYTGLLSPGGRKSVEPMAAQIEPGRARAKHQSMHHGVAKAEWGNAAVLAAMRGQVILAIERHRAPCRPRSQPWSVAAFWLGGVIQGWAGYAEAAALSEGTAKRAWTRRAFNEEDCSSCVLTPTRNDDPQHRKCGRTQHSWT